MGTQFLQGMGAPVAACLLFAAVLSYLGVHIIRRQVIFVDLALGQVSALGALVGFQFGLHPASPGTYVFSLGFAVVAAALFALTRPKDKHIPHEAVIGLVFAVAIAVTYLVVDRSAHGAEHVTDILTGTILWTRWEQVGLAAAAVAIAGIGLGLAHRRLVAVSSGQPIPPGQVLWLDFLFYACFGLVVSVTVRTIGVLPTFAMLVAPAILGCLAAQQFRPQVLVAWGSSGAAGLISLAVSYAADLDGGPALVIAEALLLLLGAAILAGLRAHRPREVRP